MTNTVQNLNYKPIVPPKERSDYIGIDAAPRFPLKISRTFFEKVQTALRQTRLRVRFNFASMTYVREEFFERATSGLC